MINMCIQKKLKANAVSMVFVAIILFYLINNYLWLKLSSPFDVYQLSRGYFYYLEAYYNGLNSLIKNLYNYGPNASVYHISGALIAFIFKKSFLSICLLNNLFYFVIALVSIYKIGQRMDKKTTGLLAAVIFSLYPAIFGLSRLYVVEFAVMAIVAFSIWCLLATEGFSNRKYSILFGLAAGWGMMVKYSFLIFIIGPLFYTLVNTLSCAKQSLKTRFLNIAFAGLLSLLIMGGQYFNLGNIREYLSRPFYRATPWYEFWSIRVYSLGLIEHQLAFFFFFIFLVAFFVFLFRVEKKQKIIFLLWIFIPWLTFTIAPHPKLTECIISCLPAIALISGFGLIQLLRTKLRLRQVLISLIIIIGIIQYYEFSFGLGLELDKLNLTIRGIGNIHYYTLNEWACARPRKENPYDRIISSIAEKLNGSSKKVLLLPYNNLYVDPDLWRAVSWAEALPFDLLIIDNDKFIDTVLERLKEVNFVLYSGKKRLDDPNFVNAILKLYRNDLVEHLRKKDLETLDRFIEHNLQDFKLQFHTLASDFELDREIIRAEDGTSVYLYNNNKK